MAHRISIRSGKAEFAYTGQAPWHGLGEAVPSHMSATEAVAKVLPWTVSTRPVAYALSDGGAFTQVAGNARAIVRDDAHTFLGMATGTYHPIQNAQAGDVADALIAEGAKCVETIGALDDGARCFMLLALDKSGFDVRPGDIVQSYFLLRWGHDGRTTLAGKLTNTRVVCHNTLTAAGRAYAFDVKHTASAKLRIEDAREALGVARKAYVETRDQYRALAKAQVTGDRVASYFTDLFPAPSTPAQDAGKATVDAYQAKLARWQAVQDQIVALYQGGKGAAPGTAWGAYNAVTEYLDHVYVVKADGKVSADRQASVLFGAYADVRDQAFAGALALAK